MSSSPKSKKVQFCTSFFTYYVIFHICYKQINIPLATFSYHNAWHDDSNKLYPSMAARHQIKVFDNYALNNPFFWNRCILLVEFIEVTNFVKGLKRLWIIWIREEIMGICKRLYKSWKKCGYFYYLFNKHNNDFSPVWTMFTKIHRKFMYNTWDSDSFHGQGRYGIKRHFLHLPAGRACQTYGVYIDLCLNIKTSVW